MELLSSINKIYSMVIQDESNNIAFLPKANNNNTNSEESNTLINIYDQENLDTMKNQTSIYIY